MNKSIHKLISIFVLIIFITVFFTISCKKPADETEDTLNVPETTAIETVPETTAEVTVTVKEEQKFIAEYTIQSGDTLGKIAEDFYGNDSQPYWELIYEANKDIIEDAGLIYPGQIIKIPELPENM